MPSLEKNSSDEINIKEILCVLWAYKFLILLCSAIFLFVSLVYLARSERVYTAISVFSLDNEGASRDFGGGAFGQLGGIAALAGLATGASSTTDALIERFSAREFMLDISNDLNFKNDPYFNKYNSKASEDRWKTLVKKLVGWKSIPQDPNDIINWSIVLKSQDSIIIDSTDAGAITVSVNHNSPHRAAEIANHVVDKIIELVHSERRQEAAKRLKYLSTVLADALLTFENAQSRFKQFTLTNSLQSVTTLSASSILLDDLRSQQDEAIVQLEAIDNLLKAVETSSDTPQKYRMLRRDFPVLDQSTFRRILGISEKVNSWSWPSLETLQRVKESISDRFSSLTTEISKLEKGALRYAKSADQLANLSRDLKIAETTYTVLVEQVKSQSLVAGFTPNKSKIIAVADVPLSPSAPVTLHVVSLSAILGLFFGAFISWILTLRKGVVYSRQSLLHSVKSTFRHSFHLDRSTKSNFSNHSYSHIKRKYSKLMQQVLLETVEGKYGKTIVTIDSTPSQSAAPISRMLGRSISETKRNFAFLNLSEDSAPTDLSVSNERHDALELITSSMDAAEYRYMHGNKNIDWLFSEHFEKDIEFLLGEYEVVLFSINLGDLEKFLVSKLIRSSNIILYARLGKSKIDILERVSERGDVKVLLHA